MRREEKRSKCVSWKVKFGQGRATLHNGCCSSAPSVTHGKYLIHRVLIGRMSYDDWVWVGGCLCVCSCAYVCVYFNVCIYLCLFFIFDANLKMCLYKSSFTCLCMCQL